MSMRMIMRVRTRSEAEKKSSRGGKNKETGR